MVAPRAWTRQLGCGIAIVFLIAGSLVARPGVSAAQISPTDVRTDADWILKAQLSDGSIANHIDKQNIWPYLSHFASLGLSRAAEVSGQKRYSDSAWRWLRWYQSKMDATGFVTDYRVDNGVPVSNGFMDSTDSYAGMFLVAVRANYRVTRDNNQLNALKPGIAKAVQAIEATQEPDGLTWAKPTWRVKYLMDQAETYAGLVAAVDLATLLKDSALATRAKGDADRMKAGVDKLWNATTTSYDWAKHDSGVTVPNNWSFLYSDALQQAWAVAFGLVDRARADALMTRFNIQQPNWARPAATALFTDGSTQAVGYWPVAGWSYASLLSPVVPSAVSSIRTAALSAGRAWPFTTGNAGQLILFQSYSPVSQVVTALPGFAISVNLDLSATTSTSITTTTTTTPKATTTTTTRSASALAAPATTTTAVPVVTAVPSPPTTLVPTTTTTTIASQLLLSASLGPLSADLSASSSGTALAVDLPPLPPISLQLGSGGGR